MSSSVGEDRGARREERVERKVARGRVCGDPGGKNWVAVVVGEGSWPVFFSVFRKMSVNINVDGGIIGGFCKSVFVIVVAVGKR